MSTVSTNPIHAPNPEQLAAIVAEAVGRWAQDPTPDRQEGIVCATKGLLGYLGEGSK